LKQWGSATDYLIAMRLASRQASVLTEICRQYIFKTGLSFKRDLSRMLKLSTFNFQSPSPALEAG
jgi:hypothetical protein